MNSKFGDIGSRRKPVDEEALQRVVNGGPLAIKETTTPSKKTPFQVMLDPAIKNEIKALAAVKGIKMNEFFMEMYNFYKKNHENK